MLLDFFRGNIGNRRQSSVMAADVAGKVGKDDDCFMSGILQTAQEPEVDRMANMQPGAFYIEVILDA